MKGYNLNNKNAVKHGLSKSKLYGIYSTIKTRCKNPNSKSFKNYGLIGISICPNWDNDFLAFYNWATSSGYEPGLEIDRINSNEGYSPANCRWVKPIINRQNKKLIGIKNTSGYRGVSYHKNKWHAYITNNYKRIILGKFSTAKEAAITYNQFVIQNKTFHPLNIIND